MTGTPDRLFQSAARDALIERIDQERVTGPASRSPSGAPAADWLRTAFATLLVGGAVAAVWVVVAGLQPPHPDSPRPAAVASPSTARPTAPATSAPAPDPSPSPSATTNMSPPPAEAATPTVPVLVTPAGWHQVTRAELHAYVLARGISADDPANQAVWEQETWSDVLCMAGKGYVYDPVDQGRENLPAAQAGLNSLTPEQRKDFQAALWGPSSDAPYAWDAAGCHGVSVHEAGRDDAH